MVSILEFGPHICGRPRLATCLAAWLTIAGCATHHPPQSPPPAYPPVPEAEVRELRSVPEGVYDRVEIVTVAAEVGEQLAAAIQSARQSAAQKAANALVILHETEFLQKSGKRKMRVRRITYLAIHRL